MVNETYISQYSSLARVPFVTVRSDPDKKLWIDKILENGLN